MPGFPRYGHIYVYIYIWAPHPACEWRAICALVAKNADKVGFPQTAQRYGG